jgi:hypothetical protein
MTKCLTVKRQGKGSIRKHPDMERYYVRVGMKKEQYSAVVFSLEEAEKWISNTYKSKSNNPYSN